MKSWTEIPMREYPNLSVITEEEGRVVATVQREYAKAIEALPELVEISRELLDCLKSRYKHWSQQSTLGRLEKAILRIQEVTP